MLLDPSTPDVALPPHTFAQQKLPLHMQEDHTDPLRFPGVSRKGSGPW